MKSSITFYTPNKKHQNGVWSWNIESKMTEPEYIPEVGEVIKFSGERAENDYAVVFDVDKIVSDGNYIIDVYCERCVGKRDRRPRQWLMEKAVVEEDQRVLAQVAAMDFDNVRYSEEVRNINPFYEMDGEEIYDGERWN